MCSYHLYNFWFIEFCLFVRRIIIKLDMAQCSEDGRWYFIVVLAFIYLTISDIEQLF